MTYRARLEFAEFAYAGSRFIVLGAKTAATVVEAKEWS
jgi:hypothetical protein